MSGRNYRTGSYSHQAKSVRLWGWAVGAGAGADMTLQYWNPSTKAIATAPSTGWQGIKSVTYNAATGKYKINLQDRFNYLLGFNVCAVALDGSTAPVTPTMYIESIAVNDATAPSLAVVTTNGAGTATAPTSNTRFMFCLVLSDSSAP